MTTKLTDDELRTLMALLVRYAETDLDQFDHWRLATSFGPVYVEVTVAPPGHAVRYRDMPATTISTIVTPGDGTIDTLVGLTLLAHEHHGGHLDGIAACDAPWCLRGKGALARLDPRTRVAGQFLTHPRRHHDRAQCDDR